MVKSLQSKNPGFTEYANMKAWPKSVQAVLEKYPDALVVIPGHGRHGDISLLYHTIELLEKYNRGKENR
jgi:glyoxylase-like metal-dependent hydrolase (beta-lactamase superfamily II)